MSKQCGCKESISSSGTIFFDPSACLLPKLEARIREMLDGVLEEKKSSSSDHLDAWDGGYIAACRAVLLFLQFPETN